MAHDTPLLRTPLYDLHLEQGARMVPFAGYDMPVQYAALGVLKEHLHTRAEAGLFDVSHMGQALLKTDAGDPAAALERLVPSDIVGLKSGQQRYTVLLNDQGGIIDDLMVARLDAQTLFLVVNAACKDADFAHIAEKLSGQASLIRLDDRALLALQGPRAEDVLAAHIPAVRDMAFMDVIAVDDLSISRSGYTGEDGFEISIPGADATAFAKKLLGNPAVALIGLGARDSLRLEAGLCLYGHDITTDTTPVEASLKWTLAKRRREEKSFPGASIILTQIAQGAQRQRIGLKPQGKAPVREGAILRDGEGREIGHVTSGGFGPTLNAPIAMGYIDSTVLTAQTPVFAEVRGQLLPCDIASLPFVPARYKKG